ncbi:1-acyl-sn-glycerol-3-phosphate acyltransferase [bacterium]|nr:1-acyl-sn-glycerol-3-phosphate acyltransferase [bacterium]
MTEVVARVLASARDAKAVEAAVADTIYHERRRLEKEKPSRSRDAALRSWDDRKRRLVSESDEQTKRELLSEIATDFAREVLGNFDPRVYHYSTKLLPLMLSGLLNATSPTRILKNLPELPSVKDRVIVDGEIEVARELKERGTLIVTPTHLSNLDSIVLGYGFYDQGFPPLTYGAGLNLFTNPLISYFMHNLGAYKVDRRKTARVYKDVLKEYAAVSLELGYHNLFFPGGTRSRSGAIEQKLKLGLLGAGVRAYVNNLRGGREKPNVYVIPVTLSYELVLEAETLIDDFLKEVGQHRYIIMDDEFAQPLRIYSFLNRIFELDSRIYLTLGSPLDPFGNSVTREGISIDGRGRAIDTTRYVLDKSGKPAPEKLRDEEYTRELGEKLVTAFHRNATVMGSTLLAFVVFEMLRANEKDADLYRFLRASEGDLAFADVSRETEKLRVRVEALAAEGKIRLDDRIRGRGGDDLVLAGLRALGIYHNRKVVERRGDRIVPVDRNLLYYYRNRLLGFDFEKDLSRNGAEAKASALTEGASARLRSPGEVPA